MGFQETQPQPRPAAAARWGVCGTKSDTCKRGPCVGVGGAEPRHPGRFRASYPTRFPLAPVAQVAIKSGFPQDLVQQAANPQPRARGPMQGGKGRGAGAGAKGPAAGGKGEAEPQAAAAAAGGEQGPAEVGAAEAAGTAEKEAGGALGGVVGVVASRLLRSSCVSKAVEEARKDFLAKFGKGGWCSWVRQGRELQGQGTTGVPCGGATACWMPLSSCGAGVRHWRHRL